MEFEEPFDVPLGTSLWLQPQQFVLAATLEFVRLPAHLAAQVLGRSSWGRMGLVVATAVVVQPGYAGNLTLELVNEGNSPIRLYPGVRIAQLIVQDLGEATAKPYDNRSDKYAHPTGPQASRASLDRDEIDQVEKLASALKMA